MDKTEQTTCGHCAWCDLSWDNSDECLCMNRDSERISNWQDCDAESCEFFERPENEKGR